MEAACKIVFTQRLKRSGMSWTVSCGHVILALRVIWPSGIWKEVHQRYLTTQALVTRKMREQGMQSEAQDRHQTVPL
jgi:hypothetical protein